LFKKGHIHAFFANRVWDVLHVLLGRNFFSDLPTLKLKNVIFLCKKPRFLSALSWAPAAFI